jgi:hypothetical protein
MIRQLLIIFSATIFLVACEKELPYSGEGKSPVLVLNGILVNHETFVVHVSRSVFFLSNQGENSSAINNAVVTVTNLSTGVQFQETSGQEGYYYFPFDVEPNTGYKIVVSHPNYPTVSSELTTVGDIVLDDVDTSSVELNAFERERESVFRFNDMPGENKYLAVFKYAIITPSMVDTSFYYGSAYSIDPSVDNEASNVTGNSSFEPRIFFTDETFSNQYKHFTLKNLETTFDDTTHWIYNYTLLTATDDTYKYFKTVPKNFQANQLSDPTKAHSNIVGGFGIFGSISYSTIKKY